MQGGVSAASVPCMVGPLRSQFQWDLCGLSSMRDGTSVASVPCGAESLWPQFHVRRDLCGLSSMWGGTSVASIPCGLGSLRPQFHGQGGNSVGPVPCGAGSLWPLFHAGWDLWSLSSMWGMNRCGLSCMRGGISVVGGISAASVPCGAGSVASAPCGAGSLWPQLHAGWDLCGLSSVRGGVGSLWPRLHAGKDLCGLRQLHSSRPSVTNHCAKEAFRGLAIYSGAGAPTHPTKARGNQGRKTESGEGGLEPTSGHLSHCGTLREEGVPNAWIFIWRNGVPTHPAKTREKQGRKPESGVGASSRPSVTNRIAVHCAKKGFRRPGHL